MSEPSESRSRARASDVSAQEAEEEQSERSTESKSSQDGPQQQENNESNVEPLAAISEDTVAALLSKSRLTQADRQLILDTYGCSTFKELKCLIKEGLRGSPGLSYQTVLKYLFIDNGLDSREAVDSAIETTESSSPDDPSAEISVPDGLTVAHFLALGSQHGTELCVEFANVLDPLPGEDDRNNRAIEIEQVIAAQNALDAKDQIKMQYYPKMRHYLHWIVYEYVYDKGDGTASYATPPFSKPAYGIKYLGDHQFKVDGTAYSHSHMGQVVQALNAIWGREKAMFPTLVTWQKPGALQQYKQLLKQSKSNIVKQSIEEYRDRGLGSHMDGVSLDDLVRIDKFFMNFDVGRYGTRSDVDISELEDIGVKFPEDEESDAFDFRIDEVEKCLRDFDTPAKLFSFWDMHGVQTNTYLRGFNCRNFQAPDYSVLISDERMGICQYPNFEPARLLTYNINSAKTLKGDKNAFTHSGRHSDVHQCAHKAASYRLVNDYSPNVHGINEVRPLPDFSDNRHWYDFPLWTREPSQTGHVTYDTHHSATSSLYSLLDIQSGKITHAARALADKNPADVMEVARLGQWKQYFNAFETFYKTSPAYKAIRGRTGFKPDGNYWFLKRQTVWIYRPKEDSATYKVNGNRILEKVNGVWKEKPNYWLLVLEVFPFVEQWIKELGDPTWRRAGKHDTYFAATGLKEVFVYLAIVFLQDAVVLRDEFPNFILYNHTVFRHPLWSEFKAELEAAMDSRPAELSFQSVHKHDADMQDEIDRIYHHLEKTQDGNVARAATLQNQIAELENKNTQLVNLVNSLVSQNHELVRVCQLNAKTMLTMQKDLKDLKKLHFSSAAQSGARLGSPNQSSAESLDPLPDASMIKLLSPLQCTRKEAKEIIDDKSEFDKRMDVFKDAVSRVTVPRMKDTPKVVYEAFFEKKIGPFSGLVCMEKEADALKIAKKTWLVTKGGSGDVCKRYNQLKRVAVAYKHIFESPEIRQEKMTPQQMLKPESCLHERSIAFLTAEMITVGAWQPSHKFGTNSLQRYATHLQKQSTGSTKERGRPKKSKAVAESTTAEKPKATGTSRAAGKPKKTHKRLKRRREDSDADAENTSSNSLAV